MVDPFTAAGLASSIIAFLTLAHEIGKRTCEFSRLAGELPADLQSAKDLVDIIARSSERLKLQVRELNNGVIVGPQTEYEADLTSLFDQCAATSKLILAIFDELNSANSISKALISIRRQRKIENIRNELDRCIISIKYILIEVSHVWTQNIR